MIVPDAKVGFVLTVYNDWDLWETSLETLLRTFGDFSVVIVDSSPAPLGKDCLIGGSYTLTPEPNEPLAKSLNRGLQFLYSLGCSIMGWTHADVSYPDPTWLSSLVGELVLHPSVGKLSPDKIEGPEHFRPGNQCPWVMGRKALTSLLEVDGCWFDENFRGIGGCEDWDINARLLLCGWGVMITPASLVSHPGMGTRSRRDTTADGGWNAGYYGRKWNTMLPPV